MSDQSQAPGWWLASDGRWYPPEAAPPPPSPAPSYSQPVAWWYFLSSAVAAGFWLLAAIAPAQNGTMGSSESSDWLVPLSASFCLAALGLTTGSRLAGKGDADGGVVHGIRILLVLGMAGLVLIMGALVIGLALSLGSGDGFEQQAPPGLWFLGYAIAASIGISAGAAVPVRAVTTTPSKMATRSLAAGLVGLFLCAGLAVIPSLVAVVTGHIAVNEAKDTRSAQADRDFAHLGLVTGYLGLVVGAAIWIGSG